MRAVDVVDRTLDLLVDHDMHAFVEMFAPDGVMEFPLATGDATRAVRGHLALHDYLDDYASILDIRSLDRTVHVTTDPEVVIVEFTVDGVVVATDRPYRMVYIAVITVRDDAINRYRDYWNSAAVVDIVGADAQLAGGQA
ncbi:nuclear transport factor 2 family protein [Williamsia maris]|uniref:Ketosteroid isomerase-related protein n=1 Tax=Williamsia maris TaxID=72806 RepID=A0ABT1HFD7_9NOCA|nr:nuclear transport factor 2 family protein [Williamsia maris]MCP2176450.1 Ketosteroid isomerase-related protein [Williamsia maris]